jgi:hypothetical protein
MSYIRRASVGVVGAPPAAASLAAAAAGGAALLWCIAGVRRRAAAVRALTDTSRRQQHWWRRAFCTPCHAATCSNGSALLARRNSTGAAAVALLLRCCCESEWLAGGCGGERMQSLAASKRIAKCISLFGSAFHWRRPASLCKAGRGDYTQRAAATACHAAVGANASPACVMMMAALLFFAPSPPLGAALHAAAPRARCSATCAADHGCAAAALSARPRGRVAHSSAAADGLVQSLPLGALPARRRQSRRGAQPDTRTRARRHTL